MDLEPASEFAEAIPAMVLSDINRHDTADDWPSSEAIIRDRCAPLSEFWIAAIRVEYPTLAIQTSGDWAVLRHHQSIPLDAMPSPDAEFLPLSTGGQIDGFMGDYFVPLEAVIAAAKQFWESAGELPTAVGWTEI